MVRPMWTPGLRLALGLTARTGWAACVLVGGSLDRPRVEARERVELLADPARFVFHRAAEGAPRDAARSIEQARGEALARALAAVRALVSGRDVPHCAVVAKVGPLPALDVVLSSHPRIHAAEGLFYRDVFVAAAREVGLRPRLVAPSTLDAKDPRLVPAGRIAGKPWSEEWKLAALAAWNAIEASA